MQFSTAAYLIEAESERVLVDTGLNPAAVADPAAYHERPDAFSATTLEQERSVADQVYLSTRGRRCRCRRE